MPEENKLVTIDKSNVLEATFSDLVRGMGGVAISEKKDFLVSISRILQRTRSIGFLGALQNEWIEYIKKGIIADDYSGSDQHLTCLHELLEAIDEKVVDERRFSFFKKIFIVGAAEILSSHDDVLPHQFIRLARKINSGEVLLLETVFRLYKSQNYDREKSASLWLQRMADETGLKHKSLVEMNEDILIELHILSPRIHGDRSGVNVGDTNRLTSLGVGFCEFIAKYEEL